MVGGFLLLTFSMLSLLLATSQSASAAQTVPYKVNFQGRLADNTGASMPDGLYNMTFRLFSGSTGGSAVWTEARQTTSRVSLTNGQFNVQLGDVTTLSPSLFTSQPLYLEVELPAPASATCSTAGCAVYTEGAMTPRQPLASSPYAMNADTLDGLDSTAFVRSDGSNTLTGNLLLKNASDQPVAFQIQNSNALSLFIADTTNMRIQIGSATANATAVVLVLDTKNTSGEPTGVNGAMYYNSASQTFRCYQNGWRACIGGVVATSTSVQTIANTAVETPLSTTYTVPANTCVPGRVLRFTAQGTYKTAAVAPTITTRLYLGATLLADSGDVPSTANVNPSHLWTISAQIICQTMGASGTVETSGYFDRTASSGYSRNILTNATPGVVNTTVDRTLSVALKFNTASPDNIFVVRQVVIESLDP